MSDMSIASAQPAAGMEISTYLGAQRAAPALDPQMAYGVAQTAPSTSLAITNAQATAGYGSATTQANQMSQMSASAQRKAWSAMNATQQQMLTSVGYAPPAQHASGFFSSVLHDVGHAAHDVFNAAGSPLRAVTHAYRTLDVLHQQAEGQQAALNESQYGATNLKGLTGGGNPVNFGGLKTLFSPSAWAKAWNSTQSGERTYDPAIVRSLQQQYGSAKLATAQQIADTGAALAGVEQPQFQKLGQNWQQVRSEYQSDPELQSIVKTLLASKISPGRTLVGEKFQVQHPAIASKISGVADATFDWFGDPLNIALNTAVEASHIPYIVSNGADVARLTNADPAIGKVYPSVQAALSQVDGYLRVPVEMADGTFRTGDIEGLVNRFPSLGDVREELGQLARSGKLASKEDFVRWLQASADEASIAAGKGLPTLKGGQEMLRAGRASDVAYAVKAKATNAIDWASDTPLIRGPANAAVRLSKLMPVGNAISPVTDDGATQFRRLVDIALPRDQAADIANQWALSSTAEKFRLYTSANKLVFDAAGMYDNPETAKYADAFLSKLAERSEVYSATGDKMLIDGVERPVGIGATQVLGKWELPDPLVLLAAKNKATLGDKAISVINASGIDTFMQRGWKPLQLLRLGFAPRVAGEELFGALLRDGASGLARARLAASAVQGEAAGVDDRILPWHPLQHVWASLTDGWSEDNLLKTMHDGTHEFAANLLAVRTRAAFRNVEAALAGDKYMNAARVAVDQWGPEAVAEHITAIHGGGYDYLDTGPDQLRASKKGLENRVARLVGTGTYRNYAPEESLYSAIWNKNLNDIANDYLFRAALPSFGDREAQIQDVIDQIESPGARTIRQAADRYSQTLDGRIVGVDATQEEATRDWAAKVVDHVNHYLTDGEGRPIGNLPQQLLEERKAPPTNELEALKQTTPSRLPMIHGEETVPVAPGGKIQQIMENGFHGMVGRPMNWMSRQPMLIHNLALSLDELQPLRESLTLEGKGSTYVDDLIEQAAAERAVNKTIPYIHDPQLRSQFAVTVRNLMPFWFAQEQFYKRWARTFDYAPSAFRQAQLINQGLRHSGLIHVDDTGNEYINVPLLGQLQQDVLGPVLKRFGVDAQVPVTPGFAMNVKYMSPGLSNVGQPSSGPLITLPLKAVVKLFPELEPVNQAVEGTAGANTGYLQQIVPSWAYRFYEALGPTSQLSAQYGTAMLQVMQNMEATGHGLPENASSGEYQAYLDRVKSWTRIAVLLRAMVGFAGPTAPTITPGPQQVPERFRTLLQTMPVNQAAAELINEYGPDATPYTVFASTVPGKEDLPATTYALDFINSHMALFKKYPLAAGWLIPNPPAGSVNKFSDTAYREQLALGLRQKKAPDQMLNDIVYARDSPDFFKNLDVYEKAKLQYTGTAKANLENGWAQWENSYFQQHPTFSDIYQSKNGPLDRAKIVADLTKALNDPASPSTPTSQAIQGLLTNYRKFTDAKAQLSSLYTSAGYKALANLENGFAQWSQDYVQKNPLAAPVYLRVVQPDIGGTVAQQAIQAANDAQQALIDQQQTPAPTPAG